MTDAASFHIFTARKQPATRFKVQLWQKRTAHWVTFKPGHLFPTICCRKMRAAKNLLVQVYYDKIDYSCKPGKGCRKGKR